MPPVQFFIVLSAIRAVVCLILNFHCLHTNKLFACWLNNWQSCGTSPGELWKCRYVIVTLQIWLTTLIFILFPFIKPHIELCGKWSESWNWQLCGCGARCYTLHVLRPGHFCASPGRWHSSDYSTGCEQLLSRMVKFCSTQTSIEYANASVLVCRSISYTARLASSSVASLFPAARLNQKRCLTIIKVMSQD